MTLNNTSSAPEIWAHTQQAILEDQRMDSQSRAYVDYCGGAWKHQPRPFKRELRPLRWVAAFVAVVAALFLWVA